ncbi:MAG: response regulator transcription factor, partial [Chloroflexi bacterium]|nr:response regulator transcription factor [Chloroflexota bacterium]
MKILLIGDDPNILRTLRRNLVGRGYEVLLALDDQESFEMAQCNPIDSIILNLDFTTMEIDGLAICAKLREISGCPIIVLSSIGSERTKIEALDLGADDYLVMPFSMGEFLARVRSSLRRWTASKSDALDQDHLILSRDLLIDLDSRQVTVREKPVHLTPKEYEVLLYLARQTGKVVTHRELL